MLCHKYKSSVLLQKVKKWVRFKYKSTLENSNNKHCERYRIEHELMPSLCLEICGSRLSRNRVLDGRLYIYKSSIQFKND